MYKVVFLQAKFPSNRFEITSLFQRWETYGKIFRSHPESGQILLFSTSQPLAEFPKVQNVRLIDQVEVYSNPFIRFWALNNFIRKDDSRFTLVCGDNQISLFIALCLRLLLRSKVLIQIQFHGDTYTFRFNKGFRGFIRVCFSRLGIQFSDSIRIVSNFQKAEISQFNPKASHKFVVAPIPIDVSRIANPLMNKSIDISFVGRLHGERGISELVEIIKLIKEQLRGARVVIAGDGNLRPKIEHELAPWIRMGEVSLRGYLNSDQILEIYSDTKVLISTAPTEGYGLTLREAALSQVTVIARYSKGTLEAQRMYPGQIKTFSTVSDAVALIKESLSKTSTSTVPNLMEKQTQKDSEGLFRLVNSWINN